MSAHFSTCARAALLPPLFPSRRRNHVTGGRRIRVYSSSSSSSSDGNSYLDMWRKAVDRERKSQQLHRIAEKSSREDAEESLEKKTHQFEKILEVPPEERDRIQRLQVIDRAAAAIAAARALIKESPLPTPKPDADVISFDRPVDAGRIDGVIQQGQEGGNLFVSETGPVARGTPGPDFWSWSPEGSGSGTFNDLQPISESNSGTFNDLQPISKSNSYPKPSTMLMEKDHSVVFLSIPLQSGLSEDKHKPPLPPFQSLVEIEKVDKMDSTSELPSSAEEHRLDELSSRNAIEAAEALIESVEASSYGANPDGSRWWKETGVEKRPDGVVCKWTLTRGVSANGAVEWEDKYWEASDLFDYKELGSEKSGRDAAGNVWHEYWKESMWQDLKSGLVHMEKTADKWGKNGKGDEWHEKWWEHYDASGKAEKWAHKWCSIDPNTPLDVGHAHVWHERWGEKYDGKGSSIKYTDKWAERSVGDGWAKWGDKWDENFDQHSHGVKQGETWWEGEHGERWNRTWGEHHNGSGWVHKYGKSSSGEHWDTHVQQETWYERHPHFGFHHCFENSVQLRAVPNPSERL